VRELKNALACAVAFVDEGKHVLEPHHVRLFASAEDRSGIERLPLGGQKLDCIERVAIQQTLSLAEGNKAKAASLLGIAVSTLYEKLKKYGLAAVRRNDGPNSRRGPLDEGGGSAGSEAAG
jgi:DNA-binding NtrC family response regulator